MRMMVVLSALLLVTQVSLAGTLESQKDGVQVLSSPDKSSSVLETLKKGDKLSAGERKGMYWQVKTSAGKSGFVSMLAVRMKADENLGLVDAMREAVKKGRSQSAGDGGRVRSSVMGVRGLDDTSQVGLAANLRPNFHAVYALEDFELSSERVISQGDLVIAEVEQKVAKIK